MPAEKPVPVTSAGLARLQAELQELLTVKRPAVAERIHQIRELAPNTQGDGEYEDAKNEQAFVESRIRVIEKILATAEIIDESVAHSQDSVHLGATVVVTVNGKTQEYTIVGVAEVDPLHGLRQRRISSGPRPARPQGRRLHRRRSPQRRHQTEDQGH